MCCVSLSFGRGLGAILMPCQWMDDTEDLLAPTGALIVTVVYYIYVDPQRSHFLKFRAFLPTYLGRTSNTTLRILSVKGGGGTPQIRKSLFAEKKSVNGGEGGGVTPQIRNLLFGPKSGVF